MKAAEQGYSNAQEMVAFHYLYGRGVKKDRIEAEKWLNKAAQQGDKSAINALEKLKYDFKFTPD